MEIRLITNNKKDYLELLLLADEQENMIDKYLERGDLFALYDGELKSTCVVTDEGGGVFELQSLATYEKFQRQGFATKLIEYIREYYSGTGRTLIVGTGDTPTIVSFYERRGFRFSRRIENYFLEHYDNPIIEDGVQLTDKVYFSMSL
ncbi:MAG: GNAT family N-acetyltransferase [Oscillospiraceae bacterium]|nr:GNAT family N-acetyltransferase [Oscillospiraceae bacterium]